MLFIVRVYMWKSLASKLLQQLEKISNEVLKFDRRIRYAAVLDESGRVISGGMRRGVPSLEPQSEDLRLVATVTIQLSTDKTWDKYWGKTQFTFIKREKVNVITFNIENKLLLVSTEPDFTLQQAQELRNMIITNYLQP